MTERSVTKPCLRPLEQALRELWTPAASHDVDMMIARIADATLRVQHHQHLATGRMLRSPEQLAVLAPDHQLKWAPALPCERRPQNG